MEGSVSQHAATALRLTFSHALESLFAFVGAAIQAPLCPAGWLLKYKYIDLKDLIEGISQKQPFENKFGLENAGWDEVVAALFSWRSDDEAINAELDELRDATAFLWKSLAKRLLDEKFDDEYMSLKHGFRVRSGAWHFAIGVQDGPGIPAPPERMRVLAYSPHGSSLYRAVNVSKYNWAIEEPRVNWNPSIFAKLIPLVADSLDNVISCLRSLIGDSSDDIGLYFMKRDQVEAAMADPDIRSSSFSFMMRSNITAEMVPAVTPEEILTAYRKK